MSNQTSEKVRALYEKYPYPPRAPGESVDPYVDYMLGFSRVPLRHSPTFLDAGCGTGACALGAAVLNKNLQVFACDFNQSGLDAIEDDIDELGLNNIELRRLDLLDLPEDFGPERGFDVIYCMGVIHHTPDPAGVLKALAGRLAPQGVMRLMVYADKGRHALYRFAGAVQSLPLSDEATTDERVMAAKSLLMELESVTARQGYPVPSLRGILADSNSVSLEEFVDRYLHPHDEPYNLGLLREHIEAAGLKFHRWFESRYWDLEELLPEASERGDFPTDDWQRFEIVEELFDRDQYDCYLVKPGFLANDGPLTLDCSIKLSPQVHLTEVSYRGFGLEHKARVLFYPDESLSLEQAKILKAVAKQARTLKELLSEWGVENERLWLNEASWLLRRDYLFRPNF